MDKIVNDSVFGLITLKPYICTLIDIPQFQRLRWIWQLGLVPFVYPTGNHTRFEHCIGTYWLASKLVNKIQDQLINEGIEDISISGVDIKCVEIAALYHDIGHGPFSHFWDNVIIKRLCTKSVPHEYQFGEMWRDIKKNDKVSAMLRENNITDEHEKLIERLVIGKPEKEDKKILFCIVNNSESGMDVDKWDYLARDSIHLGQMSTNYRIDIDRMIHFARAIKDKGEWKIAFRDKESLNILHVFQLRYHLHKTAYQHRKVKAMEEMMYDGFKKCIDNGIIDKNVISKAEWILEHTDSIFWKIKEGIPEFDRILKRDIYKPLIEAVKYELIEKKDDLKRRLEEYLSYSVKQRLSNFKVVICEFKLGNKDENPIFKVPFYTKKNKDEIFYFNEDNIPPSHNVNYNETRLIIFYTESVDDEEEKSLLDQVTPWFDKDKWHY